MTASAKHQRISSGSPWEPRIGYATAVRAGAWIAVSGCTASSPDGPVGGDDAEAQAAEAQAAEALRKVGEALNHAGAGYGDVIRTRIFLTDIDDADAVGRAHGRVFGDIRPATTMVEVSALTGTALLVEIDADALLDRVSTTPAQ